MNAGGAESVRVIIDESRNLDPDEVTRSRVTRSQRHWKRAAGTAWW